MDAVRIEVTNVTDHRADEVDAAIEVLRRDGLVIVGGTVDPAHLDLLLPRMLNDLEQMRAEGDLPIQYVPGHVQQFPPPIPPFLFEDILCNQFVKAVSLGVLGAGAYNCFYSGNTNLPGSHEQPVHVDEGHLWPGLSGALPTSRLVVNIPLVDVTEENGSTEVWLGSHHDSAMCDFAAGGPLPERLVRLRRAERPPVRANSRKGDVVVRDIRLWHRGMPNRTRTARPMLALVHNTRWMRPIWRIRFPEGTQSFLANALPQEAEFIQGSFDYLHGWGAKRVVQSTPEMVSARE